MLPVHPVKAGVGDDLMSITGGITDGSLFGGTGNDSFNFTGGRATGFVDTGSWCLILFSLEHWVTPSPDWCSDQHIRQRRSWC